MPAPVFKKTQAGRDEVSGRKAGLTPAERQVLIVVNGAGSTSALAGLADASRHLQKLLDLGLIEVVSGSAPAPMLAKATNTPAAPAPAATPAKTSGIENEEAIVRALQRQAGTKLVHHFGPDTATIAEKVLLADTLVDFNAALDEVEAKLAIYLGRKKAAEQIAELKAKI
ncbi:hypothetical protein [Hydrogenophaga sp. 5NK40-0174]|uniref:hypothetical protein n=1 Tax=Hydrogenophaga sp. 5NK40-0174 TaxID=3127649 RepID=UPI00310C836F